MRPMLLLALLAAALFTNCHKHDDIADPPVKSTLHGTPMPKGAPTGTATTQVIGAEGGTIISADSSLTITIPVGAVSANTTFSIQSITNQVPTALGLSYRLLPEGTHFAQPVTISFHYTDSLIEGTREEDLFIASQDSVGFWRVQLNSVLNTTARTLSVKSDHFSDWAFYTKYLLFVYKPSLDFKEVTDMWIRRVSIEKNGDTYTAIDTTLPPQSDRAQWSLTGQGALHTSSGNTMYTVYIAPEAEPTPNPVIVTAKIESVNGNVTLARRIYIAHSFFEIVYEGNTNIYPGAVIYGHAVSGAMLTATNHAGNGGTIIFKNTGGGNFPFGSYTGDGANVKLSVGGVFLQDSYFDCERVPHQLSGNVNITKWGIEGEYVEGEYSGSVAVAGSCTPEIKTVSGRFRALRIKF